MTLGETSTLNCDPDPGSQFNVESWLGSQIQREIKTQGQSQRIYSLMLPTPLH